MTKLGRLKTIIMAIISCDRISIVKFAVINNNLSKTQKQLEEKI